MDVELQILKHLKRAPKSTVFLIDRYCSAYNDIFPEELKAKRLTITLEALKEQKITVVIDETGDRKKGTKTDYVARQYARKYRENR